MRVAIAGSTCCGGGRQQAWMLLGAIGLARAGSVAMKFVRATWTALVVEAIEAEVLRNGGKLRWE